MINLESIAATPGLDGIYVGPADQTLGLTQGRLIPGFNREEQEMIAALRQIVAAVECTIQTAWRSAGVPGSSRFLYRIGTKRRWSQSDFESYHVDKLRFPT